MKLLQKQLPDDHNIFFFGDKHDGTILSYQKGWEKLVNMLHSKYKGCKHNFAAEGGDDIEAVTIDDKRFSPDRLTEKLPMAQIKEAIRIRQPIKHLYLWKLEGNHEYALWRFGDCMASICEGLGVDYGTHTAKGTICDNKGRIMYKVYDTHGRKQVGSVADDPVRRTSNMKLSLKRHLEYKAGDCAVMIKHHTHKLLVCEPTKELFLTDDGEKINEGYTTGIQQGGYIAPNARWYGNAGSFLKLFGDGSSGYAERAEYDPTELGFLILTVRDRQIVGLDPIYL